MLLELVVENYAVVENLRIRFHPGLNVLTGETGSGKSIVVDAVSLLLGGRASTEMIRSGAQRARVSGIFEKPKAPKFAEMLTEAGIEPEDDEIIVEREVLANGKSRAFLGSRPVTAALLKDLALYLGDIHGQHDQQRLFSHEAQRELVDEYGNHPGLRGETARLYASWQETAAELAELDRQEQERLRQTDLWTFQKNEIEAAALEPSEDAELENEQRRLANTNKLAEAATAARDVLYEAEHAAADAIRVAIRRVDEILRIDDSLQAVREQLKAADVAVSEAAHLLGDYIGRLEADPNRMEEVMARLAIIDKLKRKYGGSADEILAFLEEVTGHLQAAESAGERRAQLAAEQTRIEREYQQASALLTEARRKAARKLEKRVEQELAQLAMEKTVFRIEITQGAWTAEGTDAVSFVVSPNVGEEPKPLEKIASGGELSRVALALKTCINEVKRQTVPPTLVFDEVDSGIGGAVAESVGRRLKKLADLQQVLCVTHLAQIAAFADHHFQVEKKESKGRITTVIEELNSGERVNELGRMIAGSSVTPAVLQHAKQLLDRERR